MRLLPLLLILLFDLAAPAAPAGAEPPIKVVASFTILADLAARTGGGLVAVTSLVGPGADLHQFQPRPEDARKLAGADLVLVSGLGMEGWLGQLVQASGYKGPVVVLSDHAPIRKIPGDPHCWQDIGNARLYVAAIADALAALRPGEAQTLHDGARRYDAELAELQRWAGERFAAVPPDRRIAIVPHDGFSYLASAYGLDIEALQPSTEAEPSPRRYAALSDLIRLRRVAALFGEAYEDSRIMRRLAADGGSRLAGELYADTLSPPGGPAPDYVTMMRRNVTLLSEAMR